MQGREGGHLALQVSTWGCMGHLTNATIIGSCAPIYVPVSLNYISRFHSADFLRVPASINKYSITMECDCEGEL